MADIYDTLHPVNTPANNLYPNIKPEQNIPDASISKQKLNFSVGGQGAAAILPGEEYVDIAYNGNPGSVLFPKGTYFIYTRDGWLNNTPPYTGTYNTVSEDFEVMAYWYDVSENLIKSSEATPSDDGIILSIPDDDFLVMVLIKNPNENGPRVIPVYSIIPTSLLKYNTRDYDWAALQVTGFTINDGEYPQLGSGYLVDQFSTPVVAANTNYYKICNMKILSVDIGRDIVSTSAIVWIAATTGSTINTAFVSLNLVMDTLTKDYSASGATLVGGAFDSGKLVYTIEFDADKGELTITLYAALSKDAMLAAGNVCYVRYRDAQGDRQSMVPFFYGTDTGSASAPSNSISVKQIGTAFNPEGAYPNLGAGKDGDGNQISTTYAKQTGSYPNLGAGKDSEGNVISETYAKKSEVTGGGGAETLGSTKTKLVDGYWTEKTWSGLTDFPGFAIWTDGENIYYSNGSEQYVLDKSTSTWQAKTWNGLTNFNGDNIWTDGENIYYSFTSNQYVLDKATSTWTEKTWRLGQSGNYDKLYDLLKGNNVWTDGENIYYNYEDNAIGAYSYALINPLKKTPQIGEKYGAVKTSESGGGTAYHHHIQALIQSTLPEGASNYRAQCYFEIVTDSSAPITTAAELYIALMSLEYNATETRYTPASGGMWVTTIPDPPTSGVNADVIVGIRATDEYEPQNPETDSRAIVVQQYRVGLSSLDGPFYNAPFYYAGLSTSKSIHDTVTDQYGNYIAGGD